MGQKPSRTLSKQVKTVLKPKTVDSLKADEGDQSLRQSEESIEKPSLRIPMLERKSIPQHQKSNLSVEILKSRKKGGIPIEEITKTLQDYQLTGKLPNNDYETLAKYCRPPILDKELKDGTSLGHWVDDLHQFSKSSRSFKI